MKRVLATAVLAGFAAVAISTTADAGTNTLAKILLHNQTTTTKNQCVRAANVQTTCQGYDPGTHTLAGTFSYAYLLVVNGGIRTAGVYDKSPGVAGVQCGIQYANDGDGVGVDVYGWFLCSTLQFITPTPPVWPASGGGNLMTWDATGPQCTPASGVPGNSVIGATAVFGYFYIGSYSPSQLRITPRPVDGIAQVANCGSQVDNVQDGPTDAETFLGVLGIAGGTAINPCGREPVVATESTTWSGVKTLIHSN
jgi:hypothetical protein